MRKSSERTMIFEVDLPRFVVLVFFLSLTHTLSLSLKGSSTAGIPDFSLGKAGLEGQENTIRMRLWRG